MTQSPEETLDLREIGAAIRGGWLWIAAGGALGLLLGASTLHLIRPEYKATSTALLRSQGEGGESTLSRLAGGLGALPGLGGGSEVETEVKILTSRAVIGQVVDSLRLQADVLEPQAASPITLFSAVRVGPQAAGREYRFTRQGHGYAVEGPGAAGAAVPGTPYRIPGGVLTLRAGELPESFTVAFVDREAAITRVQKGIAPDVTGEYVELVFRAHDPVSASAVPNALLAEYLQRRKTTDRGVNQHRYEFLQEHAEQVRRQLAQAEAELRSYQEASGVVDPKLVGQTGLERATAVRAQLETTAAEARSIRGIIQKSGAGRLSARELAAYPTFLSNAAINNVLAKLFELETERSLLLEKRTERDPEVVALSEGIRHLEARLGELGRDYLSGLTRQEAELRRELAGYAAEMGTLPRHAQESFRREREVRRLSETLLALQAQLVQARLGAIAEGGDVRQIDRAVPPARPVFPNPVLNLMGGLLGGLFFGMVAAIGRSRFRQEIRELWEVELATRVPAVCFDPRLPLALGTRTSLLAVCPVGRSADAAAVAERLAEVATLQGRPAVVADLTQGSAVAVPARLGAVGARVEEQHHANGKGAPGTDYRAILGEMENRFEAVFAVLPGIDSPAAVAVLSPERPAVLVARARQVTRAELQEAVEVCARLGTPVVAVVLQPETRRGRTG
jgi:tyrosine-protein kinase Etk/Wzc